MKLLIVDEEIIDGGVETFRRRLLPALAEEMEQIVWVLPGWAAERYRDLEHGNVVIETLNSPAGWPRIVEGIARRAGQSPRTAQSAAAHAGEPVRLRHLHDDLRVQPRDAATGDTGCRPGLGRQPIAAADDAR